MPVRIIQTAIPLEDYEKFKHQMEKQKLTEYALAQDYILVGLNEPQNFEKKKLLLKLAEFFKKDFELTGR